MYFDSIFDGFTSADTTARMNQTVSNEIIRQQGFQDTGNQALWASINNASAPQAQRDLSEGKQEALSGYKSAEVQPYVTGGKSYDAEKSPLVQAAVKGYETRTNEAKASNQAYSNLSNKETINAMNTQEGLNLNAARAGTSASALSSELTQAQNTSTLLSDIAQVAEDTTGALYQKSAGSGVADYSTNSGVYSKQSAGSTSGSSNAGSAASSTSLSELSM